MELNHEFRVAAPFDTTWKVLTDVELVAPCLPGAQLTEIEGDEYRGNVKVKVGPITAQYQGEAHFVTQDRDAGTIVLHGEGRDTRGQGNAAADITVQLTDDGDQTTAVVTTDLKITGKVAQFGRGVLADVSSKLLDQFVESLESTVLADGVPTETVRGPEPAPAATEPSTSEIRTIASPAAAPVDLLDTAGAPLFKRLAPIITAIVLVLFLGRRRRRRRAGRA